MNQFPDTAALIIVDVQEAFDHTKWGSRNNPAAERNIAILLSIWRETGRPVFHIQHVNRNNPTSLFRPGSRTARIKDIVLPLASEPVVQKTVNSAFIGTDLENRLRIARSNTVVITGLTTNHCVETTTRMAGNLGFNTYLVSDATAAFERTGPDGRTYSADEMHNMSLVNLHEEFATIITMKKAAEMALALETSLGAPASEPGTMIRLAQP